MAPEPQQAGIDWPDLLRRSFGRSFWVFVAIAASLAAVCYAALGPDAFESAIDSDRKMLVDLLPRVAAAQLVAGFVWVMLPRDRMSAFLKKYRGKRGLVIATAAGCVTPGGPASAFPFLAILAGTGADRGILVAYITSWALLGMQRIIVWDIPLMGIDFSMLRFLIGAPLPILAGLLARRLPFSVSLEESPPPEGLQK